MEIVSSAANKLWVSINIGVTNLTRAIPARNCLTAGHIQHVSVFSGKSLEDEVAILTKCSSFDVSSKTPAETS